MSDPAANVSLPTTLAAWPARVGIALVRLYQLTLSPVLPAVFGPACGCRFHPTCSHYAIGALREHGFWRGLALTLWRLAKCTPLHPGGFDEVPPRRPRPRTCRRVTA